MAEAALEVIAPGAHRHDAVFHQHGNAGRLLGAEIRRVPGLHFFRLHAGRVEMLLEISFAVEQGKRHQRNTQVGRGAQRISGKHTEAARVCGHAPMDGDFH